MTMPNSMANEKLWITSPPKMRAPRAGDGGHAGEDGARQRLVDRDVEQLVQLHALVLAQVLADAVGHDHGVVHRVAEDSQQRRDDRQSNSSRSSENKPDGQEHVVEQRDHGADGELPFEAEPDVDDDGEDEANDGDDAGAPQLARHRRPDHLDAALRVVGAQRIDHLLHGHLLLARRRPAAARRGSARRCRRRSSGSARRRCRAR